MAARDNKAAFTAYPAAPDGNANFAGPLHGGQIDLSTGQIDWILPLGKDYNDFSIVYDMAIAANGDVIFAAVGYGALLLGEGIGQFDGVIASFSSSGVKRFAKRLEIFDVEPSPSERPHFVSSKIITDDVIRVQTGFYVTKPNQPTFTAVHLFSFALDGSQTYRVEVPEVPDSYGSYAWAIPDGSLWVYHHPGPLYHYSKGGDILDTFTLPTDEFDIRAHIPMGPSFGLVNATTKGVTNELYRFEIGSPLVPVFHESTPESVHAASFNQTLDLSKAYFYEMGYSGLVHRFSTIDAQGNRGPVTAIGGVSHQFELFDEGGGVFFRIVDGGTEWITQRF